MGNQYSNKELLVPYINRSFAGIMFNTLASYLFWNTSNTDTENSTSNKNQTSSENTVSADTAKPTEKFENVNIPKSILTEVEDDWLLLDKEGNL